MTRPPPPAHPQPEHATTLEHLDLSPQVRALLKPLLEGLWLPDRRGAMVFVEKAGLRVELDFEGEGNSGDYDEDDPDDMPLMRFACAARVPHPGNPDHGELVYLDETSYCTQVDDNAPWEVKLAIAATIFHEVKDKLAFAEGTQVEPAWGQRAKRACEELSWISDQDTQFQPLLAQLREDELAATLPDPDPAAPPGPRM